MAIIDVFGVANLLEVFSVDLDYGLRELLVTDMSPHDLLRPGLNNVFFGLLALLDVVGLRLNLIVFGVTLDQY